MSDSCPDKETLSKALLGEMRGAPAELLEEHLSTCTVCAETLRGLTVEDAITASLTHPVDVTIDKEALSQLMDRLRTLLPGLCERNASGDVGASSLVPTDESIPYLAEPKEADEIGQLAQYRILRLLGQGGMGRVFEAEDSRLRRRVALKVMLPGLAGDAGHRARFVLEARATAIHHPRLVTMFEIGEVGGVPFLAMELLQGESLEARLQRNPGPVAVPLIVKVGRQIAEGLDAVHRLGFVHRDIKPSNIWLQAGSDDVRLLDFGLARAPETDARLTQPGVVVGSPGFLSPEQAAGKTLDARSDLFSLGAVLYLLATGVPPFQGSDLLANLSALATVHPRPASELNHDLPEALSHLITRLLSKQPALRPGSAREIIEILDAIQKAGPAPIRRPPKKWPRRAGIAACLLALLAVAAIVWFPNRTPHVNENPAAPPAKPLPEPMHVAVVQLNERIHCALFTNDGKAILTGGDDRAVRLWDIATGNEIRKFAGFASPVRSMALTRDGRKLVTGIGQYVTENKKTIAKDCLVQLWDVESGAELASFDGHESPVASVAISSDAKRIISGGPYDRVRTWDVATKRPRAIYGRREVGGHAVAISDDGKWGIFGDQDPWVSVIDLDAEKEVSRFLGNHAKGRIRALQFAPGSTTALCCAWNFRLDGGFTPIDCTIRIWDVTTGTEATPLTGHGAAIHSAAFSPDGRFILSGGGTIAPQDGKPTPFDCAVRLWDVQTGKELGQFAGHTAPVCCVAISPDGRLGLSVGDDLTVRIWDLRPHGDQ